MSWIIDHVPWWVYAVILGGGGAALFAFVPGALALVVSVWTALPAWMRWALGGFVVAVLAYFKGRNVGRSDAEAEQRQLDERARTEARAVNEHVDKMDDKQIDKELEKDGGLWDSPPGRKPRG